MVLTDEAKHKMGIKSQDFAPEIAANPTPPKIPCYSKTSPINKRSGKPKFGANTSVTMKSNPDRKTYSIEVIQWNKVSIINYRNVTLWFLNVSLSVCLSVCLRVR
jgi:hypothetical protein